MYILEFILILKIWLGTMRIGLKDMYPENAEDERHDT